MQTHVYFALALSVAVVFSFSCGLFAGWYLFRPDTNNINEMAKERDRLRDEQKVCEQMDRLAEFNVNSIVQL